MKFAGRDPVPGDMFTMMSPHEPSNVRCCTVVSVETERVHALDERGVFTDLKAEMINDLITRNLLKVEWITSPTVKPLSKRLYDLVRGK